MPHDDVQDIVQEVFLTAFRNINSLRERNALGAWLARIARNSAIEFYRRSKPTEELTEEIGGQRWPDAEAREVLDAIRSLPETYRETLVLRLVEGMTGTEIADRTGLTPNRSGSIYTADGSCSGRGSGSRERENDARRLLI